MGVEPLVFGGREPAAEDRTDPERVEIVRRYDAPGRALGPVADAEGGPGDLLRDEGVDLRALLPEVEAVRPGDVVEPGDPARGPSDGEQPVLVVYGGERAEQDSFDPTED